MYKNTMLLLMILSASCVSIKRAPLYDLLIIEENGQINLKKSRCRARCYDYNNLRTVEDFRCDTDVIDFQSGNYPIEECDGILGPTVKFFAEELRPSVNFNKRRCKRR